jgi:hypothetical protein
MRPGWLWTTATTTPADEPIAQICAALADPAGLARVGAIELNHGANAKVYSWRTGPRRAILAKPEGAVVPVCDIVVKLGRWDSAKDFVDEVDLQGVAHAAGCAPRVLHSHYELDATGKALGVLAMERLTQPTVFRWLHWLTRANGQPASWTISSKALHLPIVAEWLVEVNRLSAALVRAGVKHGDWHERNLVFDVPEVKALTAIGVEESPLEHHAIIEAMLDAIGAGVKAGRARLYVIDYGGAKRLRGTTERWCAAWCMDRRIVDADEEPPSPGRTALSAPREVVLSRMRSDVTHLRAGEVKLAIKPAGP